MGTDFRLRRSGLRMTSVVSVNAFWQEAFAPALPAARERRPATFSPHTGTETVLAFARSLGWLISAFHKTETHSGRRALTVGTRAELSMKPGVSSQFDGPLFRLSPWQGERTEVRDWSFAHAPSASSNPHPPPLPWEGGGDPCNACQINN